MRKFMMVLVCCGLTSCNFWDSQEKKTQELIEKQLGEIDWNDVDAYPIFEDCDENWTQTRQRECFENGIIAHFSKTLREYEFILKEGVDPVVQVDFLIDITGKIVVLHIEKDAAIDQQMPEFDSNIRESLLRIPPLEPAIKNRIPVKAKFRIPIILKRN